MKPGTLLAPLQINDGVTLAEVMAEFVARHEQMSWSEVGLNPEDNRVLHTIDPETGRINTYWRECYHEEG